MDCDRRITAVDVLAHPYLKQYYDPNDEPVSKEYDASFEAHEFDISTWKGRIMSSNVSECTT